MRQWIRYTAATLAAVLLVICGGFALGAVTGIGSRWRNGVLEFYETTNNETVWVMAPTMFYCDFVSQEVDDFLIVGANTPTLAAQDGDGGWGRITTKTADNDEAEVSTGLVYDSSKGCVLEARIAMNDVDGSAIAIGFSDATAESTPDLIAVTYATATATTNATNGAFVFQDPDATTNAWRVMAVNADTDSTISTAGTTVTDGAFHTVRVEILTDQTVKFWFDGEHVATIEDGVAASTNLCAYVGLINREDAANTMDVDYLRVWSLTR